MEAGEGRLYRWWATRLALGVLSLLPTACASQAHLDRALMAERGSVVRNEGVSEVYHPSCPDLLEITVAGRPDLTGPREFGPDGRVELGPLGRVRLEGLSLEEIVPRVAEEAGVPPERVRVRVVDYRSQQVYVIGQVMGQQRAVPYVGPETVLDLLKRAGGITPGAAPESVYVVRSRVAEGGRPEVFHIDLHSVVNGRDPQSNVRLQPFDQVFVGESRRSSLEKCLPPWLRPTYEAFAGLRRAPRRDGDRLWAGSTLGTGTYRGTSE